MEHLNRCAPEPGRRAWEPQLLEPEAQSRCLQQEKPPQGLGLTALQRAALRSPLLGKAREKRRPSAAKKNKKQNKKQREKQTNKKLQ